MLDGSLSEEFDEGVETEVRSVVGEDLVDSHVVEEEL